MDGERFCVEKKLKEASVGLFHNPLSLGQSLVQAEHVICTSTTTSSLLSSTIIMNETHRYSVQLS